MLTPKNSTWAAHKRIAITLGASAACLALAFDLMSALGIRINTSYSLPMGIYARTSDGHTNLIEFCPEGHAAAESSERGYRTTGVCPDGAAPLLKPIVARSGDTVDLIVLSAIVPTIIFRQWTRRRAFIVGFAYYAAASWPLTPGVVGYSGPTGTLTQAISFWLAASLILPLPWVICWPRELHSALWRLPLAYALTVVPPFGIIGWASPLTAAGIVFPGWELFGLAAFIVLGSLACVVPVRTAIVAVGLALFANAIYPGEPAPPDSWEGVQTTFELAAHAVNPLPEFQAAQDVQQIARTSRKQVIVFPEFVVPRWTEATDAFWHRTVEGAKASNKTLLIGAGLPIVGTGRYRNAVLTIGADAAPPFFERIPVPVVMWNPLNSARSVPLEMFGPGVLQVRGERAAILVCYEQLLTWPILHSALQHPTLIVGLANDHWARGTPIAAAQRAAVTAWARLFRLPKVLAVNL